MENRIFKEMSNAPQFVRTARVKLSQPQSVEVELSNGKVLRVKGEAARESINAIVCAKQSKCYRPTFDLPTQDGEVVVVAVDGKNLDATFEK